MLNYDTSYSLRTLFSSPYSKNLPVPLMMTVMAETGRAQPRNRVNLNVPISIQPKSGYLTTDNSLYED